MTNLLKPLALLAALAPVAATADQIVLAEPLAGATLHDGSVDMNVYYVEGQEGAFEVVATYAPRAEPFAPARLTMALQDGDATSFALPNLPGTLYAFDRHGDAVRVSAESQDSTLALLED